MTQTIHCTQARINSLASQIITQLQGLQSSISENCPIGIVSMENWEWPQGVALFGLTQYYQATGDSSIREWINNWYRTKLAAPLPPKNVNTMCPFLALSYLYEDSPDPAVLAVMREWADHALYKMPRTEEGGIQHEVSGYLNEGQLWDDTLYMTVLFLARMSTILSNDAYLQESIRQFLVHIKYLTDTRTGLLFHGWTFKGRNNFGRALWGRGNCWYTAGLVDYLDMVQIPAGIRQYLLSALEQQVQRLALLQHKSGLWHTLLDHPDSYLETSCSAAFAYGILKGVRKGYLDKHYLEHGWRAVQGVLERVDSQGIVHGVSYGTGVGDDLDYYRNIAQCPMPYGQSLTLLMLTEALRHEKLS